MKDSKEFMLLFRFEPSNDYQPTPEELQAQSQQWGAFIGRIAIAEKLVSTHQLGQEGLKLTADKQTSEGIHIAGGQTLGGNMIIKARSCEEAAEIAKDCPILSIGGTVEIRNIIPMSH